MSDQPARRQAPVATGDDLARELQQLWDDSYKEWPDAYQGRKFDKDLYRQKLTSYIHRYGNTMFNQGFQVAKTELNGDAMKWNENH